MIADDHPVYRGGLRAALTDVPDVVVVAEAASGPDAVDAAVEHQADVVLMDLSMPRGSGIDATAELSRRQPSTAVIALTMHDDAVSLTAAFADGARGYLVKGAGQDEIVARDPHRRRRRRAARRTGRPACPRRFGRPAAPPHLAVPRADRA